MDENILLYINNHLAIFNLAFTFIIAFATLVYAYYARKAWQENKRLSKTQMASNLNIFIDEYVHNLKSQITPAEKDAIIKTFKTVLFKKWFPDEYKEMDYILKNINKFSK